MAVWARPDIMPLKDVKVGMKGIGKTVIRGRDIETFTVEVMGILSNNKLNENILISGQSILVKVGGKVIEEAGGIAAGMSGSPVFINNKLVGGLSSGWVMTDHTVGLVTPIEEMLSIWDYPSTAALRKSDLGQPVRWVSTTPLRLGNVTSRHLWEVDDPADLAKAGLPADAPVFVRARTPVMVQGLSEKYLRRLNERFRGIRLQAAPTPPAPPSAGPSALPGTVPNGPASSGRPATVPTATDSFEPGSALGVQLARGDINLTTIGTLTYRDGKRILGFAHPFLKKGNVSFLMTATHIYHCFSSVQMPFKIGAPTEMLGVITQDREKGIAGEIGRFPALVPVQLEVTDKDLKRSRSISYQVVRDPTVFISVIESTLSQAIEEVCDREGGGTALLGIALECANASGKQYQFRRENLFYSKNDIVGTLIGEVTSLLESVIESELEEVYPVRLMLKIEMEKARRTLTIEKVEVKNTSITPGGMLEAWVTIRPFREKSLVRKARLPIPSDLGKETLVLSVYGLNSRVDEGESGGDGKEGGKGGRDQKVEEGNETFEGAMSAWVNSPKNSDLIFHLAAEGEEMKKNRTGSRDLEIQPTNLVVLGRVETTITLSEE
ncbi:MAG: stage IV sporulation protein B [Candidatus Ozemobacter sibiricus]|jgi:hypothetical protein|uniref:Stage IV sporulation protein B n=1 Tax=Candidatus Ozemobacter sibiricus TaxID=2268124 RepID=A0A367ZQY5_9BACT|nr:MAG: stage IV sporulation protein B [Candidatus Ozemobacter sibiricus]